MTTFTFFAKTEDMKRKWMEAIDKALDNVCPLSCREGSTDHTFAMFTFATATICADCDKLLRGTFFQGYQCTVCNIAVHKQCIATVRSCGAPSLPPRPPLPPSSPGVSLNSFSGDEDNIRNSASDLRRLNSVNSLTNGSNSKIHARALNEFEGDSSLGQLSFIAEDMIIVLSKSVKNSTEDQTVWWEGRNTRTGEEGTFPASLVTELDLSLDSGLRVSYEDPNSIFGVYSAQQSDDKLMSNLEEYQWFAGSMDRERAQSTLEHLPEGSFLVRISPKQKGSYAISLNYNGQVKHMRVCVTKDHHYYYLSESRYFKTIIDLVKWYEENSLCESFNLVNTNLMIPYKKAYCNDSIVAYAIALYSFTGNSNNLLSLRKGDKVAILSKAGQAKGWWKGQINDRIGYFPLAYVTQTEDFLC
jgi:guanine nucleotide exchange factor VAV